MNPFKLLFLLAVSVLLTACNENSSESPTSASIASFQVTPLTSSVPVGFGVQFHANAIWDDGSVSDVTDDTTVAWSVSNSTIASVSGGMVTGLAPGSVTVTAAGVNNGRAFSASAQLKVSNAVVTALQITPATSRLAVGLQQQYVVMATFSDDSVLDVSRATALTWSVDSPSLASVSNDAAKKGRVTALAAGDITVTASGTANGTFFTNSVNLTVTDATISALRLESQTVNTPVSVPMGLTLQFHAIATLTDGSERDITDNDALNCVTTLLPAGHTESQVLKVTNDTAEWQQSFTLGNEPYIDCHETIVPIWVAEPR